MSGLIANAAIDSFAATVGWTLTHFTWQAAIIGILACLALRLVRQDAARRRYAICCIGLALLSLLPLATAGYLVASTSEPTVSISSPLSSLARTTDAQPNPRLQSSNDHGLQEISETANAEPAASSGADPNWRAQATRVLQTWMPWLAGGWLLGVALLMFRFAGGLWRVRVWTQTAEATNDSALDTLFERLRRQVGIRSGVRLLQSARVTVPMVVGWLRPVVLVPTSLLSGLTPVELESILAHELAHIRRHDYFVNLLQNVLETLLFFHPVVWWLSRQTRIEREHCCDELAIQVCGDRPALAVALVKIEESRSIDRRLVAANGGALTSRIRRILQKDTDANTWPAGPATFLALVMLLAVATVSTARATEEPIEPQTFNASNGEADEEADSKDNAKTDQPSGSAASKRPVIRVVEQAGDRITRAIIDALKQSVARRRYLLRVQDEIMKARGGQPSNWSTKFETLVSALTGEWSNQQFESDKVTLNVPENTGLRVALAGANVILKSKSNHSIATVEGGQIDLIDPGGVIRARVTPVDAEARLIARVEVISDESVLFISARNGDGDPSNVRVRLTTETGAEKNDEVPHDGLRYKIEFPEKPGDNLRMRLSIRENLDRLRKELGEAKPDDQSAASVDKQRIMELLSKSRGKGGWGPRAESGDLRVRLSLVTKQPKVGEPLRLKLELKNFGDKPQKYDAQYYSAFRVLKVTNALTGKSDESLGMTYQTFGGEVALAPGESVTVWESADAADLFMLDEGTYRIQVAAPRIRSKTLPASNGLTVTVAAGQQTFPKRLMRALAQNVPEGWDVQIGWQQRVYLTYTSSKYKRDTATIQLWVTKDPLAEPESNDPAVTTLDHDESVGHLHLRISDQAKSLWPNCHQKLAGAAKELLKE